MTSATKMSGGPVLLVCQRSAKLPFVFEAASRAGIDLIALHDSGEPAPLGVPAVVDTLALPVFTDPERALDELAEQAGRLGLAGVFTVREEAVVWTANAAARLCLPALSPKAAALTRDKGAMRRAFQAAGLPVPGFVSLNGPENIDAARHLSPPLVVKPSGGWSSTGVIRVDSQDALPGAMSAVAAIQKRDLNRYYGGMAPRIIVEEYLDGAEFVVECFVRAGNVHVLAVGDKGCPTGPWFEETVYAVRNDLDDPAIAALIEAAANGIRAIGLTTGPAHVELRQDRHGRPHLLEIGARIGGSGVSDFIVEEATGLSFTGLCLDAARGRQMPELPPVSWPTRIPGNYIIPLAGHGRFDGIDGLETALAHPDTRRVVPLLPEGTQVPAPPAFAGYPGFIFSVHDTPDDARAYHQWLDQMVRPRWR
ncbi:ATP-grasp domain-containing protein [Fodinicurvata sp. EGI_FJ10296]|uniref:ATP-grasp domain-containing protein n=1 Tax=Fodinicurvata sp. EGI_FJ10296 TaxID=3231908 RepID=UPI003456E9A3